MRSVEPSTGSDAGALSGLRHHPSRACSAIDLQERERVRIGFDLHDGPAQSMSAALLQVKMLQDLEGDDLRAGLEELRTTLSLGLEEIYELIEGLGGRDAGEADLVARVRSCIEGFNGRFDMDAELEVEGECPMASPSLQIAIFRIVQEALSNAGRHSGADSVHVRLWLTPKEVRCEVSDDGTGFSPREARTSRRGREAFGLQSMAERARLLDGECTVDSVPGEGTTVRVRIPVWQA